MKIPALSSLLILPCSGCAGLIGADFSDKELCKDPCDIHAPPTVAPGIAATAQNALGAIVADGRGVYWVNGDSGGSNGKVLGCDASGCEDGPLVLASLLTGPTGLAIDGTSAFWASSAGEISKCALGGCTGAGPIVLAANQGDPRAVAVDGDRVYWANGGSSAGQILSCPVTGCVDTPTVVVDEQSYPSMLAVKGGYVAWANTGSGSASDRVQACATDGCTGTPTLLASAQEDIGAVATDGVNAYWTVHSGSGRSSVGRVMKCALQGCGDSPSALVTVATRPLGLALDSGTLYFTDSAEQSVRKCDIEPCRDGSTAIAAKGNAEEPPLGLAGPNAIAVGANAVYWTSPDDGVVATLPK